MWFWRSIGLATIVFIALGGITGPVSGSLCLLVALGLYIASLFVKPNRLP